MSIDRLLERYPIRIEWIAFPLHPDTPAQGRSLEELFKGRGIDTMELVRRLQDTAEQLGLPFGERTMTYNSRLAQELGKWSDSKHRGDAFHRRVFQAYFADGLNIGEPEVLLDVVRHTGLSATEAAEVIDQRTYREAVDRDWERSMRNGIRAVPTFSLNRELLVGAQPFHVIEEFVQGQGIHP